MIALNIGIWSSHMKKLIIVYHSQSGTVEALVKSIRLALNDDASVELIIKRAVDCTGQDIRAANLLLLAASECCGLMSGGIKEFLDRVYYPLMGKVDGMPYGLLISAGNDGTGAVREISKYLDSLAMNKAMPALIVKGEYSSDTSKRADELGLTLAAGLSVGMF
jgi:multimeric flavodoxin WrbA